MSVAEMSEQRCEYSKELSQWDSQTNVKTDVLEIYHNLSLKILDFLMYGQGS